MAVAIPEAVEAVSGGEAALSARGAGAAARGGPKVLPAQRVATYESRTEPPPRRQPPRQDRGRGRQAPVSFQPPPRRRGGGRRAAGQYQPVILAEFLLAVLVIAIPPLATGGDKTAQAKGGPSPYSADSLKQLIAVGMLYFILALMSGSRRLGRPVAWFGGLVLLGLGLVKWLNGDVQAMLAIFGPAQQQAAQDGQQATPGGQLPGLGTPIPPGIAAPQAASQSFISPPPGGTGTITTGQGTQLALPDAGGADRHRGGRHDRQ